MREDLKKFGQQVLDFDGCSTVWFRTWDDYSNFFTGQDFPALVQDGELFMDVSSITVYAGCVFLSLLAGSVRSHG